MVEIKSSFRQIMGEPNFYDYEYAFTGNDEGMFFSFSDCCYGDNGGSLLVRIFKVESSEYVCTLRSAVNEAIRETLKTNFNVGRKIKVADEAVAL